MKIYLATWLLEPTQGKALTKVNAWKKLLSFFHTEGKKKELKRYSLTGRNDENLLSRNRTKNKIYK